MGVMACSRQNCESIMCDRLFRGSRYICESCWTELQSVKATWPKELPPNEIAQRVEEFLDTEVGTYVAPVNVDEEIDRLMRM